MDRALHTLHYTALIEGPRRWQPSSFPEAIHQAWLLIPPLSRPTEGLYRHRRRRRQWIGRTHTFELTRGQKPEKGEPEDCGGGGLQLVRRKRTRALLIKFVFFSVSFFSIIFCCCCSNQWKKSLLGSAPHARGWNQRKGSQKNKKIWKKKRRPIQSHNLYLSQWEKKSLSRFIPMNFLGHVVITRESYFWKNEFCK